MKLSIRQALLTMAVLVLSSKTAQAMDFVYNDIYTSNDFSETIKHFTSNGTYVDSYNVDPRYGALHGLAFGPDGLLYAVTDASDLGFNVLAINQAGAVAATYHGSAYVGGNLSYGKIEFGRNGQFFVTGQNSLMSFTTGSQNGSIIYSNNQVFDVESLPSGNLLVESAYDIDEITASGALVRHVYQFGDPDKLFQADLRGIEYDAATNSMFATMLGYSGQSFQLMRFDETTDALEKEVGFTYGDDLFITTDRRLLVGSRTQVPGIFDLDLHQIGSIGTEQQMFVTQDTIPPAVPEPSEAAMLSAGLIAIVVGSQCRSRRRAAVAC